MTDLTAKQHRKRNSFIKIPLFLLHFYRSYDIINIINTFEGGKMRVLGVAR